MQTSNSAILAVTGKQTEHWANAGRRSHTALGAGRDGGQRGTQPHIGPGEQGVRHRKHREPGIRTGGLVWVCCEGCQGTWAGEGGSLIMAGLGGYPRMLMSLAGHRGPSIVWLKDSRAAENRDERGARCAGPPPGSLP